MDIINPNEIGSKISTLVIESNTKFVAVSPYIELSSWKKILINLEKAVSRGVSIEVYYREIKDADFKIMKGLGIKLFKIKGLHTKLYFNDNEAIVSSMNLYEFSDLHSIDIAILYREKEHYNKLFDYFQRYIYSQRNGETMISEGFKKNIGDLHEYLSNKFSDCKITNAKTYLFSKNLIPIFDVMIDESNITLKLPIKKPETCQIEYYSDILNKLKNHSVILRKPGENYNYYLWDICINDISKIEILNLIDELKILVPNNGYRP